jgi:hypothetical protein
MDAESIKPSVKNSPEIKQEASALLDDTEIKQEASALLDDIQPADESALIGLDDQANLE